MYFIDACFFIGLGKRNDQWHQQAKEILPKIRDKPKITSILVVSEAVNIIGSLHGGKASQKLFSYIEDLYEISYLDIDISRNAMKKHLMYDSTLSFADAVSLEIMESRGIKQIVSFDSDFDKVKGIKRIH